MSGADEPAPGSRDWWEQRASRRQPLTLDRIVAAAVAVADSESTEAVTMRRVAAELGVAAASLYRHVENRRELLVHVCEAVLGEIDLDVDGDSWQDKATQLARSYREAFRRHPGVASLLIETETMGPNALAAFETGLRICGEAGFPDDLAIAACQALGFVLRSFAILEAGDINPLIFVPGVLHETPARLYPHAESVSPRIPTDSADELFEFMLAATFDAVQRRLEDAHAGR